MRLYPFLVPFLALALAQADPSQEALRAHGLQGRELLTLIPGGPPHLLHPRGPGGPGGPKPRVV